MPVPSVPRLGINNPPISLSTSLMSSINQTTPGCFKGLRSLFSRSTDCANRAPKPPAEEQRINNSLVAPSSDCKPCYSCCSFKVVPENGVTWIKEKESDIPPPYTGDEATDCYGEVRAAIERSIADLDEELWALNREIHDNPELGYQEFKTHDTLTNFMEVQNFTVTRHICGLDTAWRAEWSFGEGGRTLGINSEMDALPGIGHACGHNLIAVGGVAIAIAVKAAMEKYKIAGKIILLGTPAEEGGGGKIQLLERGAYKEMDICVMSHPGPGPKDSAATGSSLATQPLVVEYFGHTAHAAAAPWEGQNALDAAVLAYNSISLLRQQIKPNCRVHGIIEGRDWAANIIPDYARMKWIVRAPTKTELSGLLARVRACIEAAAIAASCRAEINLEVAYYDLRQNEVLAQEFLRTVQNHYGMRVGSGSDNDISASTDFGNVTYAMPGLHPAYAINTKPGGGNHTKEFAESAGSKESHEAALKVSKGLALIGLRCLKDEDFYLKVRKSYDDMIGTYDRRQ